MALEYPGRRSHLRAITRFDGLPQCLRGALCRPGLQRALSRYGWSALCVFTVGFSRTRGHWACRNDLGARRVFIDVNVCDVSGHSETRPHFNEVSFDKVKQIAITVPAMSSVEYPRMSAMANDPQQLTCDTWQSRVREAVARQSL